MMVKEKF